MGYNVNGQLTSLGWATNQYGYGYGTPTTITYTYSGTQNNGQITQAQDQLSGETITYAYDALKRLTSASSTPISGGSPAAYTQTYQYDGFGNLTGKVLNGTSTTIAVNAANNRLSSASYDANGNMTSGSGATMVYDEANRISSAAAVSGGIEYYGYSADNKRFYKYTSAGTEQLTFYGARGEKLGVYGIVNSFGYQIQPVSTNIWFAGRLIVESNEPVFIDRLGTNRTGFLSAGYPFIYTSSERFYPYGDEITSTLNDHEKFATYTRDSYTGFDYADQRYYASTYGRFDTADQYTASAGPGDPGSWNRYSYVGGDPVNRLDPGGTCWITTYSSDGNGNFSVNCFDYLEMALTPSINPASMAQCFAVNTCLANFQAMQGGGGGPSGPLSIFQLYNIAADLAPAVNGATLTNCQALGVYAGDAALGNSSAAQFVNDFNNLNPNAVGTPVYLYNGGNNGWQVQFQNTVDDSANGNGDQGYHFAAFLQLGYEFDVGTASTAAFVLEHLEAWSNGGPVNQGDITLGIAASQLGASLRSGTTTVAGAVNRIRGMCQQ